MRHILHVSARMQIQSYRDLEAWQIGMEFVLAVYALTKTFPPHERFGLSSQLHRAAVSIPSNVSEGHQLGSKSYKHFVTLAIGSLAETSTQLELACKTEIHRQICYRDSIKPLPTKTFDNPAWVLKPGSNAASREEPAEGGIPLARRTCSYIVIEVLR